MNAPQPARDARRDLLEALVAGARRALRERGESPPASWVEEATEDLRTGRLLGWWLPEEEGGGGIAFGSVRGSTAFGHVHVAEGTDAGDRVVRLLDAFRSGTPGSVDELDLGFTGLSADEEAALSARLGERPHVHLLSRAAMERAIGPDDEAPVTDVPLGIRHFPIRAIPRDALAELDWRAFAGTLDAELVGRNAAEFRRMLDELIAGRMGRFLDEASTALVDGSSGELLAAILTGEQTPRLAVYLDVMVEPRHRRHGYGRYLVRWGFRALAALGYPRVRLWVTEANAPALALYERAGFRPVARALIYRESRSEGQPQRG